MAHGFTYTLPTITGTHLDFPVLLKGADFPATSIDGTANAINNGGGNLIAYADDTKAVQLPVEVVSFVSSGTPSAQVWIKIASASTSATIYIEADDTQTVQPAVGTTYGRNAVWTDYAAVFQLNGDAVDSSANLADGTVTGATVSSDGTGYDFDAVSDYIDVDFSTFAPTNLTISAYCQVDSRGWMSVSNKFTVGHDWFFGQSGGTSGLHFRIDNALIDTSTVIPLSTPTYLTATYDNVTMRAYIDGTEEGTTAHTAAIPNYGNSHTIGAKSDNSTDYWDGFIGWVRVRDGALSANWITTEYNNQSISTIWGTAGTWALVTTGAAITSVGGDDVVVDAEANVAFVTSGFSGEISTVQLVSGTSITTINPASINSTGGSGDFDLIDISALTSDTVGAPLTTANNIVVARLTDA